MNGLLNGPNGHSPRGTEGLKETHINQMKSTVKRDKNQLIQITLKGQQAENSHKKYDYKTTKKCKGRQKISSNSYDRET